MSTEDTYAPTSGATLRPSSPPTVLSASVEPVADALPTLSKGERIAGRYRVVSLLGRGGFGEVYWVADSHAGDAPRAMKLYRLGNAESRALEALKGEFQLLATLSHPHLAAVHDFGWVGESVAYFTQDLVPAKRLDHVQLALVDPTTLELLAQLCRALSYLHERAILHGDIKPSNVLVDLQARHLTLLDFGIARAFGPSEGTHIVGTYAYLAPEVVAGRPVDARADFYSLGVMLYRMAAGKLPFLTKGVALLREQMETPPPELPSHIPEPWRRLVRRLLSKSPDVRPASARELLAELGRVYGREVAVETTATLTSYVRAPRLVGLDSLSETLLSAGRDPLAEVVSVEGPAGTGKSRLLREVRHQLQLEGRAWIHLRVRRDEQDVVERLARRVVAPHILASLHPDDQQELKRGFAWLRRGRRQAPPVDPERSAQQLRVSLARAMLALFAIRPGVFCVDGVERLVGENRIAIGEILRALRVGERVQCFVSGRDVAEFATRHLETRPLVVEHARKLVADILSTEGVPRVSPLEDQIATTSRTGLWIEESLRHAVESGALVRRSGEWVLRGPALLEQPLEQLLSARLERVEMEARWLALHMALLDRPTSIVGLADLMGLDVPDLASTIQALVRSDLAHPRHDAGHVVYQLQDRFLEPALGSFSEIGIRSAHGRLARWYAKRRGAEELARAAHHRREQGEEARASALYLRAARTADSEGRPLRALRLFDAGGPNQPDFEHAVLRADLSERAGAMDVWSEALAALQRMRRRLAPEERVLLDVRRVRHALRSGTAREIVGTCRGALRRARELGCAEAELDLLLLAGELEMAQGKLDTADRWFRRAAKQASAQADAVRTTRAWQGASLCAMVRGRTKVALETARAAQDAARGQRDDVLRSEVQRLMGNVLRGVGRLKASKAAYRKSVRCARRVARLDLEAKSLNNLGTVSQFMGDAVEAEVAFRRSIRLKERIGAKASALLGYNNLGGLLIGLGRFAEAEPELQRAAAGGPEAGLIYSIAVGNLGDLAAVRCDLDMAVEHYVEGAADAQRVDNAGQATHALAGLTRALLARGAPGDLEQAEQTERELARIAASGVAEGQRRWLTSRAVLCGAQQSPHEAVEYARRGATVQDRATAFADVFGTELDARWIYVLALRRVDRLRAAKKQYQSCRNRLNALARRLPKAARKVLLEAHPLHRAIISGSFDVPLGRAW